MKTALTLIILVLALLASGCTSTTLSPAAASVTPAPVAPPVPAIPDLTGTWTGTMLGYEEGVGFTDYNRLPITMVVTEQKERLFAGHLKFGNRTETLAMAGVISRDGRTFALVEDVNGYTTGELTGTDTIELTHVDDADPYSVALDTLKRV